eukprot:scaffold25910_cov76-Phaeocystis_antarctica.AAC.3
MPRRRTLTLPSFCTPAPTMVSMRRNSPSSVLSPDSLARRSLNTTRAWRTTLSIFTASLGGPFASWLARFATTSSGALSSPRAGSLRESLSVSVSGAATRASITASKSSLDTSAPSTRDSRSPGCTSPLSSAAPPSTSETTTTPAVPPPPNSSSTRPNGLLSVKSTGPQRCCMRGGLQLRSVGRGAVLRRTLCPSTPLS